MQDWKIFIDGKLAFTQPFPYDMSRAEVIEAIEAHGHNVNAIKVK